MPKGKRKCALPSGARSCTTGYVALANFSYISGNVHGKTPYLKHIEDMKIGLYEGLRSKVV